MCSAWYGEAGTSSWCVSCKDVHGWAHAGPGQDSAPASARRRRAGAAGPAGGVGLRPRRLRLGGRHRAQPLLRHARGRAAGAARRARRRHVQPRRGAQRARQVRRGARAAARRRAQALRDSSGEAVSMQTCKSLHGGRGRVQHSPEAVQGLAAAAEVCEPAPAQPSRFELVAGPEGIRRAGPGRARPSLWSRASISRRPAAKAERGCFFHCQVDQAPCLALQSQASSLLVRACSSACREHGRSRRAAAGGRRARCARAAWPPWQPWRLTLYP